jgi:SAM-dependent methyltransferase
MTEPRPTFDPPLHACPLCGSPDIHAHDQDFRGIHIARCRSCGVQFMNPQYTDAHLAAYYATYIQEERESPARTAYRRAQKTANIALVEQLVGRGRFLSIGCGDGVELQVAKARGWQVEGYDVDPVTTARVAERVGAPVHTGDLFALPLESGAYRCVYMDQVLEHPKNPADYLRLCRRLLEPNGVLYLGVPNIESVSSSLKTALGKAGLKKRRGKHYDTFHHLFYYAPGTLPKLLEARYGFRVERVLGDPKPRAHASVLTRAWDGIVRRVPWLDSSLVVLARPA